MKDQLNRIEVKLDKVLETSVESKTKLKSHATLFKGVGYLTVFVLTMHATDAIAYLSKFT